MEITLKHHIYEDILRVIYNTIEIKSTRYKTKLKEIKLTTER